MILKESLALLLIILLVSGCSSDSSVTGGVNFNPVNAIVWTGSDFTFTKEDGADPTDPQNQDRLTILTWITRGSEGGQIYNAATETSANKDLSPRNTLWALGNTSQIESLIFQPFRAAVNSPQDVVGRDLVLHLVEEDIYLDIKFTSWSRNKGGGFSYVRASN